MGRYAGRIDVCIVRSRVQGFHEFAISDERDVAEVFERDAFLGDSYGRSWKSSEFADFLDFVDSEVVQGDEVAFGSVSAKVAGV